MSFQYKQNNAFFVRQKKYNLMREKSSHGAKIFVVVEKYEKIGIERPLDHRISYFIIPTTHKVSSLLYAIRRKYKLTAEEAIFLSVEDGVFPREFSVSFCCAKEGDGKCRLKRTE